MSEVIISTEKYLRLKTALGYFLNASAYRSTFPDNEDDAKQLRKAATFNELTGRNILTDKDASECDYEYKFHIRSTPEYKKTMAEIEAKWAGKTPAETSEKP